MIYYISPYATDKRLGVAFNEHIKLLPDDAWICSTDGDVMFLTSDYGQIIEQATKDHPDCILFSCSTNRAYGVGLSTNTDVVSHYQDAVRLSKRKKYTPLTGVVPAYFWVFPKSTWLKNKFDEFPIIHKFNSFDTRWCRKLPKGKVLRINHLHVFHRYRLGEDVKDITHLK